MSSPSPSPGAGVTDACLVGAVGSGSREALAEIYRRYGAAVWGLCARVCRDGEVAREVCQTVFCELWAAPSRYDPGRGGFRAWLLAQSHARAVDAVRAEASRRRREERAAGVVSPTAVASPASSEVETTAVLTTLRDSVRHAVDRLPAVERDAILLTYLGGHTYRDAAAWLGQPEGTVKSRIRSGLQRLRVTLEAQGVAP
ncbi:MAG TPA: sigma-70 family RNA polymerase sigma factor [Acidimicrobiales bacterium]|nr:sigma-70 family RNA polymerase sigma factor [Acidimicrobiales bacterium]